MPTTPTISTPLVSAIFPPNIQQIWAEYQASRNIHLRDLLISAYLPEMRKIARGLANRLPRHVDFDDLGQVGAMGLSIAVERFDPDRGVLFKTFLTNYVRGAILDNLRDEDRTPRLVQYRARLVERTQQQFEMRQGRKPSHAELMELLCMSCDNARAVLRDSRRTMQMSLSHLRFSSDSGATSVEETLPAPDAPDPVATASARELRELLTRGLTRGERLLLILYYYENMTMREIGATLDLSESRISQMHKLVIARLKADALSRKQLFLALAR